MQRFIVILALLLLLSTPLAQAHNVSVDAKIKDRYNGTIEIVEYVDETTKKKYDLDSSGNLSGIELSNLLKDNILKLNLTPAGDYYYLVGNLTLDGRHPLANVHEIVVNYSKPMPVNGTSRVITSITFHFYLNGTSDHKFVLKLPYCQGYFKMRLPKNDTVLKSNLVDAHIRNNIISGKFKDSVIIEFRETKYFWMGIFADSLVVIGIAIFVLAAYKFRGGRSKGIKLLIRSTLRNMVSLFIVLTILFYILWVAGPPLSVRVGGISTIVMRFQIIQYYHLDRPWYDQYLNWWHLLLTGGITKGVEWGLKGLSLQTALVISLSIFIFTALFSYLISIYLAVRKKGSRSLDLYAALFLALYSIPTFYATYQFLHLFENYPLIYTTLVAPRGGIEEFFQILFASSILTLLTLARPYLIARALAVKEYREPYVNTFRAVGFNPKKIRKFVRRSTEIPTITDSVLNFGWILTAQVFLEVIFKIKGMGYLLFKGTVNGNPFQLQISVIYFSLVMIAASIFSDIVIYYLDPRVRR